MNDYSDPELKSRRNEWDVFQVYLCRNHQNDKRQKVLFSIKQHNESVWIEMPFIIEMPRIFTGKDI